MVILALLFCSAVHAFARAVIIVILMGTSPGGTPADAVPPALVVCMSAIEVAGAAMSSAGGVVLLQVLQVAVGIAAPGSGTLGTLMGVEVYVCGATALLLVFAATASAAASAGEATGSAARSIARAVSRATESRAALARLPDSPLSAAVYARL
jgi:hypothetical protein